MEKKQFLLPYTNQDNQQDQYCNNENQLQALTNNTITKVGSTLNIHDVLFFTRKEQELFIPLISNIYGIEFNIQIDDIGSVISQTSLKCILTDKNGNQYFLKQKPLYSIENQELAYFFQNYLSNNTEFIKSIIKTIDGNSYFKIGDNYYFLTQFIKGRFYCGEIEQSISCSNALANIHNKSSILNKKLNKKSLEEELYSLIDLILQKDNSNKLLNTLIGNFQSIIKQFKYDNSNEEHLILHRDFAPYNMIFNENNDVIGVNDFDNTCFGSSLIDLSEIITTHSAVYYAGTTSHMREPISNFFDIERAEKILCTYLSHRSNFDITILKKLPNNIVLIWIELMLIGLLRGDFSIEAVSNNLEFTDTLFNQSTIMIKNIINEIEYNTFKKKWNDLLNRTFPEYKNNIHDFISNEQLGLKHSFEVYKKAMYLRGNIKEKTINESIIEYLSIFHDIGKFFQELHSLENISIAENILKLYAERNGLDKLTIEKVVDGIKGSDFYNYRLDPSSYPPKFIEGDIVRCSDKMQDNLVAKVDRYWFEYGVPRGATFYDNKLKLEEREKFSFDNFLGDQLNVILSIIGLRKEDFTDDFLSQEYETWSIPEKEKVVNRILELAKEIGYNKQNIEEIKKIIIWYRKNFNC